VPSSGGSIGRPSGVSQPGAVAALIATAAQGCGVRVLLTALVIPPLLARIRAEETLLRAHFGEGYDAYCRRTARLIPGLY
jgi:protein-S-isoprenylcysteine O-methyltransferase Ste14